MAGSKKIADIRVPSLAIFSIPRDFGPWFQYKKDLASNAAAERLSANFDAKMELQAKAFANGVPGSHVVRLHNANHYIFL